MRRVPSFKYAKMAVPPLDCWPLPGVLGLAACAPGSTAENIQPNRYIEAGTSSKTPPTGSVRSEADSILLVSVEAWIPAAPDPFEAERPENIVCNELTGWHPEADLLEVDTGECNYLTLMQPLRVDLPPDARLRVEVDHFDLTAPQPSEAVLGLQIGNARLWEYRQPIPAPADRIKDSVELLPAVDGGSGPAKGTPIYFHVRNHGQNSWRLTGIWLDP